MKLGRPSQTMPRVWLFLFPIAQGIRVASVSMFKLPQDFDRHEPPQQCYTFGIPLHLFCLYSRYKSYNMIQLSYIASLREYIG